MRTSLETSSRPDPDELRVDARAWDAFVASTLNGSFPQLDAWARANRANGWQGRRLLVTAGPGLVGAQLLARRLAVGPWRRGYVPRGPVAAAFEPETVTAFSHALRDIARRERLVHVVVDPALETGHPIEGWLAQEGWRRVPPRQVNRTRIVDLTRPQDALWSDLRSSARWSVNRARRDGLSVIDMGLTHLAEVQAMYQETAQRAGFVPGSFSTVVRAFVEDGDTRIVVARDGSGSLLAALVLVPCGERIIEIYGAATADGTARRASYLVKWEAMLSSRERGYGSYDMWGADDPGIAEFKAGFGGREIEYVGAWKLVTDAAVESALGHAQRARGLLARLARPGVDARPGSARSDTRPQDG